MSHKDYSVDATRPDSALLGGILRLESAEAYERLFEPIRQTLRSANPYTIDLTNAVLMNSSGIRALGTLVLEAKRIGAKLTIRGKASVPWQKKTVASLQGLYKDGLTLELL
jgi:hypothetical protein